MNIKLLRALPTEWREEATSLRRRAASVQADILQSLADDLDERLDAWETQELCVAEAAMESGYSEDHLRELVRTGRLPDHRPPGSEGRILIKRCDLPRKAPDRAPVDGVDGIVQEMAELIR